jgi:GntR family transcriptional regulator
LPPIVAADALAGPYRHAPALVEVLVRAAAAARELGQEYVGTEHLLLGLLGAATGAAKAGAGGELLRAGASPEAVWAEVARRFGRGPGGHVAPGDPRRSSAPAATSAGGVAPSPFEIALDGESRLPAYRQIMGQVKEAVAARRLRAGDRLPSVRAAARRLGVAPGTVGRAYAELERAGLLVTRRARGTRVAGRSARIPRPDADSAALVALLRPVAIEAFHLGVNAGQLEAALREAMREIYPTGRPDR